MSIWAFIIHSIAFLSGAIMNGGIIGIITTHIRTSPIIIPHITDGDGLIGTHGGDIHQSMLMAAVTITIITVQATCHIVDTEAITCATPGQTAEEHTVARVAQTVVTTMHIPTT